MPSFPTFSWYFSRSPVSLKNCPPPVKNPRGLKCAQTRSLFCKNCNFSGHFACVFSPYLHLCMFSKGWIHETFRQTAMFLHIFLIFFSISCVFLILKKPPSTCGKIQSSRDGFKLDHHLTETAMFFDQIMSRFEKDFHVFFLYSPVIFLGAPFFEASPHLWKLNWAQMGSS